MSDNQLVLHEGNNNEFALLANDDSREMLGQMLDMGVKDHKLPEVQIPSGGHTTWKVELMNGKEIKSDELDVVIVWVSTGHRTYFEGKYGEVPDGTPPNCSSETGDFGYGSMTEDGDKSVNECANCPMNEFKSAHNGKGKACTEYKYLYCLLPEQLLPIRVRVSPGSHDALGTYVMGCMSDGKPLTSVVTRMTLEEVSKTPKYSVIKFEQLSTLSDAESKEAKSIGSTLKAKMPRRTAEDLRDFENRDNPEAKVVEAEVTESGEDPFSK